MKKFELFIFSILFFLQISTTVLAQVGSLTGFDLPKTIGFIVGDPNIQQNHPEWLTIPNVIYYLIFPFIAIVAVIYGILTEIRIFRSANVKFILAFVMAGMSLPTGAMITTVYLLYTAGAWVAVVAFGVLFFIGTILWALGKGHGLITELGTLDAEMREWRQNALNIQKKWAEGGYGSGPDAEAKYMADLDKATAHYKEIARRKSVYAESAGPT